MTALLGTPQDPLDLVRALAWPRLEVWATVRRLAWAGALDTPRAAHIAAAGESCWSWGALPLGPLGGEVDAAQRAGLVEAREVAEALEAIARPLQRLESLWATFVGAERFASRAAFGLPDEPEVSQAGRFLEALGEMFEALPVAGRARLEALIEGRPVAWLSVLAGDGADLALTSAKAAWAVLGGEASGLARLGARKVLAVLVGDVDALTGRGGARPAPPWIAELTT